MSQGKVVLVTGSSSGFGTLIARTLLKKGYTVAATMRGVQRKNVASATQLRNYAKNQPGELLLQEMDVTDEASVETAVKRVLDQAGRIDVVVNNAGIGASGFTEGFITEQLHQIMDVNLYGVHRLNRAVLPTMRGQQNGLIINISSIMGRIVIPFATLYTASKFALEGYSESLRYEVSGTGVDVVVVEPGGFGTSFLGNMIAPADEQRQNSYGELTALPGQMWGGVSQRLQSEDAPNPQEVADAILTLIETPAGERPIRVVVDPLSGGEAPTAINQVSEQIQQQLLSAFGVPQLFSVKKPE